MVDRYTLDVIFYTTGAQAWMNKDHFLSNMSVFHWNYYEEDEYDYGYNYSSYVGENCTDVSFEVNALILVNFKVLHGITI